MTKTSTCDQNCGHHRDGFSIGLALAEPVHGEHEFKQTCGCHGCESIRREHRGEASLVRGLLYAFGMTVIIVPVVIMIVLSL